MPGDDNLFIHTNRQDDWSTIICSNNATHSLRLVKNTIYPKYNNHFPRSQIHSEHKNSAQPCLLRKCQYDFSPIYLSFLNCMWSAIYSTLFFPYYEKLFVIPLEGGGLSLLVSFSLPLNILGGRQQQRSQHHCLFSNTTHAAAADKLTTLESFHFKSTVYCHVLTRSRQDWTF